MKPKQLRFVQEYMKDLNGAQAAIRSGYSAKTARSIANELLTLPDVAEAVRRAMEVRAERTQVTQDWVVMRLKQIAGTDMADVADWNASGVTYKDSNDLSESARASIQSVEETTNEHGGSLKIKQHDKIKALELLGRHLGMFKEDMTVHHRLLEDNPALEVESEVLENLLDAPETQ